MARTKAMTMRVVGDEKGKGGKGNGDGGKGVGRATATAMKRAMVMATRVAGEQRQQPNGNRDKGSRQ